MLSSRSKNARLQSDFYRDQYRKTLRFLIFTVFLMFALILAILYLVFFEAEPNYYANTTDGKILGMPRRQ